MRERCIHFYLPKGTKMIEGADYITPPVAEGQRSLPFRLMVLRAVPKSGVHALAASKCNKGIA